ncbi:peptidoglycan editing factor PgeF [Polaromonas sp.]|jgi:YfiH family protein|uniref:peptidoglycan editing factor PgeF n=1 Tax=Polaromonas sp. TaxID=1869339 RepID=UPI002C23BB0B|nr:peptidoglycan editing factor PgeF [Polaromonas sp.]HQS32727.1 peptidoglycan editing factor PgeF [Polaromonas sp.]HQS91988.1 peptidoglycan editing factor PgeF [Polaromonas sp.]
MHADWMIPDWPAPAGVRAVFTTRQGGVSAAPFGSMNLGDHVGDQPAAVAANRAGLQSAIGSRPVFLKQVHGRGVLALAGSTPDGLCADASVTSLRGTACTVMVADCLPVLLCLEDGSMVAAAHAGWRGLAGAGPMAGRGILEAVLAPFRPAGQVLPAPAAIKIIAWLGPCIGPSAFEVGAEVKAAFELSDPAAGRFFAATAQGKYLADLPGLARFRLQALGVTAVYGNDGSPPWCTVSNPSRFFSHRRDAAVGTGIGHGFGTTGRMAACIWRV